MPADVVVLDRFPLTVSGKVDRAALAPAVADPAGRGELPEGATEQVLAELIADLLKLPAVGRHDSFFGLGGDSITSIVLVSAARRRGFVISPRDVFEQRTVSALARVARRERPRPWSTTRGPGPCRSRPSCTRAAADAAATNAVSTSLCS